MKDQIVAVLDDRVVRAAFRLAEKQADRTAQIERAEAALAQAEDALTRVREIWDQNAATESELVAAEAEYKIASADLNYALESHAEASASLELARARLEEHLVRAPFDAIVVRVHAKPGALLSPGKPLLELVSVDGLCVDLYLPASIAATLQAGDHYALSVQEPAPAVVAARVRYVEPRIDPVSRTIRVVFDLEHPNPPERLFAGALARPAKQPAPSESLETAISETAAVDVAKAPLDD
jgi:RND family efflux transporter MFP subunit